MDTVSPSSPKSEAGSAPSRWRQAVSVILLIVLGLSMLLTITSVWTSNQINNTDRYVRTVGPMASDPAIQKDIANRISLRLSEVIDRVFAQELISERRDLLTVPLRAALDQYVYATVLEVVESDQFSELWIEAHRVAHQAISAILNGEDSAAITNQDGVVTLNLQPLIVAVLDRLQANGLDIVGRIPTDQIDASYVIFESQDLAEAQFYVYWLDRLAWYFPLLVILTAIGYALLTADKWRAGFWLGITLTISMTTFLVLLATGRWQYLRKIHTEKMSLDTASAYYDAIGHFLRNEARLLAVLGILIAVGTRLFRPGGRGRTYQTEFDRLWNSHVAGNARVDRVLGFLRIHVRDVAIALVVVCCLLIVSLDRVSLGWIGAIGLFALIGFFALQLVQQLTDAPDLALSTATGSAPVLTSLQSETPDEFQRQIVDVGQPISVDPPTAPPDLSARTKPDVDVEVIESSRRSVTVVVHLKD